MRRCFPLAILCLLLLLPHSSLAQGIGGARNPGRIGAGPRAGNAPSSNSAHHADDEGTVEFRSETILVQVPVVVTDKSGAHVHNLTRDDFQLFENKKEQKITAFEEIQSSHEPLKRPTLREGQFSNLAAATPDVPRTITLVALDTVNTPFLDQAYGRKQLIKYLADHATPDQIIGLVAITGTGLKVLHNFSGDPATLIQALKKLSGELPSLQGLDIETQVAAGSDPTAPGPVTMISPGMDPEAAMEDFVTQGDAAIARMQQDRAIEITMRAFLNIARSVAGIPGRKSLLWATGSFPFYMDSPGSIPAGPLASLYEETMAALNDAKVSVYPIDVRGLVNYSPAADASFRSRNLSGPGFSGTLAGRSWLHNASLDTLRDFAEMTGGKAFYNSNDVAGGFQRAIDDSSSYYMLGYYLDTKNTKAGWRQLKVKLHKSGIEVRARSGFFVTNPTINPAASKKNDIDMALASPFESTGIPVDVQWQGSTPSGDKKKIDFAVHVGQGGVSYNAGRNDFTMEFVTMAVQKDKVVDTIGQTVAGEMKPETLAKVQAGGLAYRNSLHLAPGQYTVRFVVRDNLNGKIGSVTAPLTVN